MPVNTSQLSAILSEIEGKTTTLLQSPIQVQEYLVQLTGWLAYSAEAQALAGKEYNAAKKKAYINLEANFRSTGHELKPMLAKDFVASQCGEQAYAYDLAERTNRCLTHTLDAMRSVLSSQKSEMRNMNYQP